MPAWITSNLGRAKRAFTSEAALSPQNPERQARPAPRPAMQPVNAGLSDGPKPPGMVHMTVKRRSFNQQWREELRRHAGTRPEQGQDRAKNLRTGFSRNAQQTGRSM